MSSAKRSNRKGSNRNGTNRNGTNRKGSSWPLQIPTATSALKDLIGAWTDFENGRVQRREMTLTGESIRDGIPAIKCFMAALATHFQQQNYLELFYAFINGSNAIVYWVEVLQGSSALEEIGKKIHRELQAQTGLLAPEKFARQVDKCIRYEINSTPLDSSHIYFLYHPDTDWHAEFFHRVKDNPLPINFLGLSENLDSLCAWMLFLRRNLNSKKAKSRFYVLIPAYRPMLIKDPLEFPEELFPLTLRCDIHDSAPYVWLNLPTIDKLSSDLLHLDRIGNLARPPSEWGGHAVQATILGTYGVGATATIALEGAVSVACPPLAPFIAIGGMLVTAAATYGAASAVEGIFEEAPPRLLGQFDTEDSAHDNEGSEGEINEEGQAYSESVDFNHTTRRVSRRRRRRRRRS